MHKFILDDGNELSGRVIFSKSDHCDDYGTQWYAGGEKEGFSFYCGPEAEDEGILSDNESIDTDLREVFKNCGLVIEIGASENYHIVQYDPNFTTDHIWEIIKQKLIERGAVEVET